jgi:hypothetical protein
MPGFNIGNFAGQDNAPGNVYETSRRHRYLIKLLPPVARAILLVSHKCGRPTPEIDRIVMHRGQDEIYLPGKNRWLPIEISFYEIHGQATGGRGVGPGGLQLQPVQPVQAGGTDITASELFAWWASQVVIIRQSTIRTSFKGTGEIDLLDGADQPVLLYKLYGIWPSKVSPDTLDYSDNSICEITVTLQMDKCDEEARTASHFTAIPACNQSTGPGVMLPLDLAPAATIGRRRRSVL